MTVRSTRVATDVRAIEDELVKLERALEDAEERRVALKLWVAEIRRALGRIARLDELALTGTPETARRNSPAPPLRLVPLSKT